ncbi:hypothetical protein SAE01_23100 [Segetibacter aerophilus]|uniref:Uncharacterized protein n=1 Tax=Segetibacter aerophilus TaxID=670293 RepID=A0A512BD06_9BACT|nr:hypothetical protein SAE01_23100 [Segetibacter aerophilus]
MKTRQVATIIHAMSALLYFPASAKLGSDGIKIAPIATRDKITKGVTFFNVFDFIKTGSNFNE